MTRELAKEELKDEIANGISVVDFWAPWCMPCKQVAPIIDELAQEYEGQINVIKVNVDDFQEEASANKISSIPSILIFKDGVEVDRKLGVVKKEDILKTIKNEISLQ